MVQKLRIVAADDDSLNLLMLKDSIEEGGHIAHAFAEGNEAWNFMLNNPQEVDMAIFDRMMDTMSGLELVENMKMHPDLKNIPVIIQSGEVNHKEIEKALKTGIVDYLKKPYTHHDVIALINKISAQKGI